MTEVNKRFDDLANQFGLNEATFDPDNFDWAPYDDEV